VNILESIRIALEAIRANLMRSILTTLGIMIGIAAVIAVVAIGQGGQSMLIKEMESFGTNNFYVYIDWARDEPRTGNEFTLDDLEAIKTQVEEISYLSPIATSYESIRGGQLNRFAQITGTNSDYHYIANLELKEGRFFTEADSRRRVAIIDEGLANEFFAKESAIGQRIMIKGNSFVVMGVLKELGSIFNMGGQKTLYIPIRSWLDLNADGQISHFEGASRKQEQVETAIEKTVTILERRHRNEGLYMAMSMEQQMDIVSQITGIMTLIIGSIAGISLLVGGIGVMNIMLVSVTERTKEIGLRMALGARRQDILTQFLIEAIVLCLIGGVIGMTFGAAGAFLIATIAKWPPLISWTIVVLAFAFSATIGLIFGLLPANKASRLDPIEALRRD